jgi:hypothetical protein
MYGNLSAADPSLRRIIARAHDIDARLSGTLILPCITSLVRNECQERRAVDYCALPRWRPTSSRPSSTGGSARTHLPVSSQGSEAAKIAGVFVSNHEPNKCKGEQSDEDEPPIAFSIRVAHRVPTIAHLGACYPTQGRKRGDDAASAPCYSTSLLISLLSAGSRGHKDMAWEIRRTPEQLAFQLKKGWLQYSKSDQECRRNGLAHRLETLSREKLKRLSKKGRPALTTRAL